MYTFGLRAHVTVRAAREHISLIKKLVQISKIVIGKYSSEMTKLPLLSFVTGTALLMYYCNAAVIDGRLNLTKYNCLHHRLKTKSKYYCTLNMYTVCHSDCFI